MSPQTHVVTIARSEANRPSILGRNRCAAIERGETVRGWPA